MRKHTGRDLRTELLKAIKGQPRNDNAGARSLVVTCTVFTLPATTQESRLAIMRPNTRRLFYGWESFQLLYSLLLHILGTISDLVMDERGDCGGKRCGTSAHSVRISRNPRSQWHNWILIVSKQSLRGRALQIRRGLFSLIYPKNNFEANSSRLE